MKLISTVFSIFLGAFVLNTNAATVIGGPNNITSIIDLEIGTKTYEVTFVDAGIANPQSFNDIFGSSISIIFPFTDQTSASTAANAINTAAGAASGGAFNSGNAFFLVPFSTTQFVFSGVFRSINASNTASLTILNRSGDLNMSVAVIAESVVPVPAALPLLLSGFALMGFYSRRRGSHSLS